MPCEDSPDPQYSVPGGGAPGSTHFRSREWTLPVVGPDRRDRRPPARRRPAAEGRGARLRAHARHRRADLRDGRRPALRDHAAAARARPEAHLLVAVGDRLERAAGHAPARHRRLRRRAAAHARDGHRPRLRRARPGARAALRAAAGRRRVARRPVRRAAPSRRRSTSRSPRSAATAARGRSTARPARSGGCDGDARVRVNHFAFSRPNLSIPRGSRVTWRFGGDERHDATLAAGPVGFSSPSSRARRALVAALRHAGRVPRLLLAAPRVHVAVRARALTRYGLSVRRSMKPLPAASSAAMTAQPPPTIPSTASTNRTIDATSRPLVVRTSL